ncbi:MAG: transposase [Gammaproteobacteria bacterium RBG_16_57_12]|nr:MAG: transposase [Gammaproteobacteria bacterium RBG_16_57_12]
MPRYRRAKTAGATYFFTLVTCRRQNILCDEPIRTALRHAIRHVQASRPFAIDAWVLLPDHLHCIWTLPPEDNDFPARWSLIKRHVSLACAAQYKRDDWITPAKRKHRESTIWQRRYWEHQIRDETDYRRHMDYIHHNPVKHGLCTDVAAWPYSTFHRHVRQGKYPIDWGTSYKEVGEHSFGE